MLSPEFELTAFDLSGLFAFVNFSEPYKVHITSESKQELQINYVVPDNVEITRIAWINASSTASPNKSQKKKRKRSLTVSGSASEVSQSGNKLLAIGTKAGDILIFSVDQSAVLFKLSGVHSAKIMFLVSDPTGSKLWSCDREPKIGVWDLNTQKNIKIVEFTESFAQILNYSADHDSLLLASNRVHMVDASNPLSISWTSVEVIFPISHLITLPANPNLVFASGLLDDRVLAYKLENGDNAGTFKARLSIKLSIAHPDSSAICTILADGSLEIFANPLTSLSRKSKKPISHTSTIKLLDQSGEIVNVQNAVFQDGDVILEWANENFKPVFMRVPWKDESGKAIEGPIEITIGSSSQESSTTDASTTKAIEAEETLTDRLDALEVSETKKIKTGKTPESFAVTLSQALKTSEEEILEACLLKKDEEFIQTAVKRLDSALAVMLLEKIADKVTRTPSRAISLTAWIKWVMITHGGYLISQPDLARSIAFLHSTISSKMANLPRLLALQGRVQMLRSQMQLRREIMEKASKESEDVEEDSDAESDAEEIEEAALIVNGEEDFDDDDEDDEDDENEAIEGGGFFDLEAEESEDMESDEEEEDEDDMSGMEDPEDSDGDMELDESEEIPKPSVKSKSSKKHSSRANGKSRR